MKIVIDNSGYALGNLGDVAMLQVAVRRIRGLWPESRIGVLTSAPELLRRFCPTATPVAAAGLSALLALGYLPGRWRLPSRLLPGLSRLEARVRARKPEALDAMAARRARGADREALSGLMDAVDGADLYVVSGGGFFTDSFEKHAKSSLELLRRHQRRGVPTAMFGQGIGPVSRPGLRRLMQSLFPSVGMFGLREGQTGPALLRELGVAGSRITVTGDDAIELAREGRGKEAGHGLGINVRIAAYAGLGPDETGQLRSVLQGIARELGAPLVPIPIARAGGAEDVASLSALLEGWNGGLAGALQLETPGDVAAQVSRCRLVITGSYHAAVFALAQGIPAVGLARSDYYASKFSGLAALFGEGCRSVALDGPAWPSQLEQVARSLWEAADTLRPDLSARGSRQIELGLQTYGRLPALVADGAVAAR